MHHHELYMRRAIELAEYVPQLPFGAVLVDNTSGKIVAEGWNQTVRGPLWHGEIDAIVRLSDRQNTVDWSGISLYSTAEPCPMCQGAILWAGIAQVVFGTSIQYLQQRGWRQIDVSAAELTRRTPFANCRLIGGVLVDECNALFDRAKSANRD
jgi:tRNA(Arg) A34 adenosine deaminase TadA